MGSTPTSVTDMIPWSNGEDACVTCRKVLVRFQPGSLKTWSVGVAAARRRGKAEGTNADHALHGAPSVPRSSPGRTSQSMGCSFNGRTLGLHPGNRGSIPRRSTDGLMVQREDTALAWRKSGFDSRSVQLTGFRL